MANVRLLSGMWLRLGWACSQPPLGMLVTTALVIDGEDGFFTTPSGQRGMLRARYAGLRLLASSKVVSASELATINGSRFSADSPA